METLELKLKQASAVLRADPKELQNLVQSRVLKPKQRAGVFLFDANVLLAGLVALYLKKAFGTKVRLLEEYAAVLVRRIDEFWKTKPDFIVFTSRFPQEAIEVELKVPFRKMAEDLEERVQQLPLFQDLPRGRKRPGWKKEFLSTLKEAARDLGSVSDSEIRDSIRQHRQSRKARPEITVVAEA